MTQKCDKIDQMTTKYTGIIMKHGSVWQIWYKVLFLIYEEKSKIGVFWFGTNPSLSNEHVLILSLKYR